MAITSLGGSFIAPTKPRTANFYQASSVQNTWYTVLASTAGTGNLSRVLFGVEPASGNTSQMNRYFEIRVTIDGVQNTITGLASSNLVNRGSNQMLAYNNGAGLPIDSFIYKSNIYFKNSLQVEVRQTSSFAGINISAIVDYSLV
jgi:hypothetical protein